MRLKSAHDAFTFPDVTSHAQRSDLGHGQKRDMCAERVPAILKMLKTEKSGFMCVWQLPATTQPAGPRDHAPHAPPPKMTAMKNLENR